MLRIVTGKCTESRQGDDTLVYKVKYGPQSVQEFSNLQQFGYTSRAPKKSNVLVATNGQIGFVVGSESVEYEIELEEGEAVLHNKAGNYVKMKADGSVEIKTDKLVVDSKGVELNGNGKSFVTYKELDTALQTHITALNTQFANLVKGVLPNPAAPFVPAPMVLSIAASETSTIKTGG